MTKDKPDKFQAAMDKAAEECDQIDCMFVRAPDWTEWRCIECGKTGKVE